VTRIFNNLALPFSESSLQQKLDALGIGALRTYPQDNLAWILMEVGGPAGEETFLTPKQAMNAALAVQEAYGKPLLFMSLSAESVELAVATHNAIGDPVDTKGYAPLLNDVAKAWA